MSLNDPVRNRPGFLAHAMPVVRLFPCFLSLGPFLRAQGCSDGRSVVVTDLGGAACSPLWASQAGKQILAEGGSAMDAAIARNTAPGVMKPRTKGMGGDVFHLCCDPKSDGLFGLDASRSNGFGQ